MIQYDLKELLKYIDPASLSYQEWCSVGMALKQEGYTASDWDSWSRADSRYKTGECFRKWESFNNGNLGSPVTGGTIYELAKRGGFSPKHNNDPGHALDWNDSIKEDDMTVIDPSWLEEKEIILPKYWNPVQDLILYLQTLFQSTENVGYVTEVYENEERLSPRKGHWDRTAGELIEELRKYNDIGAVFGDYNRKAGAWIRFNPLDGNGCKNSNVSDFRYALVESDNLSLGKQNAIIRELELPVACMVYSGGKSVHAIVKIEAPDYSEYRRRVEYLYRVCNKNGLDIDTQNKNPSRLSRMPGVVRNDKKQFLMATNIGKKSWQEWQEWIEAVNDNLPDPEDLSSVWDDLPPLADCLIDGVLRKGHKMLISGPSKAGKSFALIELTIAIAEGRKWFGFQCYSGKVLYVNLELDRASCLHRFKDVYHALGLQPENLKNIDIWNLRGKAVPMDKLAPKLIRRAEKKNYTAVIIDPIYKVLTGDENSADQMANFCNQFDKICTELKCAVIYCHHHSKGTQGGKKSMDRASGSGVFARDPDALLDLSELKIPEALRKNEDGKARIRGIERALNEFSPGWIADISQDDRLSPSQMLDFAAGRLSIPEIDKMTVYEAEEQEKERSRTGWRIEGILREFAAFKPLNLWFDYPIHIEDESGALQDIKVDDGNPWEKRKQDFTNMQKEKSEETYQMYLEALEELFENAQEVSVDELAEAVGKSKDTIRKDFCGGKNKGKYNPRYKKRFKEDGYLYVQGGVIRRTDNLTDNDN